MWGCAVPGSRWSPILLTLACLAAGFRGDGTGIYPDGQVPKALDASGPLAWFTPLPTWSNASPVVVGALVCAEVEPTTLTCLDRATGTPVFSLDNPVLVGLHDADRARIGAALEEAARLELELPQLLARQSELRRELRRATDPTAITQELQSTSARIFQIQDALEKQRPYRTPPDKEQIGYATPSPTTDGTHLYAQFGNGVVTSVTQDGTRRWARWLGEPPADMNGYSFGVTASPQLVDGRLIVAHTHLMALDPATGATLWTGPAYQDYGTPAVTQVGGTTVLITPDGQVVRARDGHLLAKDIGRVWFVGAVARGADVWFAGGTVTDGMPKRPIEVRHVRLRADGADRVVAEQVWTTKLEQQERVYATPVVHQGRLFLVDDRGTLYELDAATGDVLAVRTEGAAGRGFYPSPVMLGETLWFGTETGRGSIRLPDGTIQPRPSDGLRSTPVYHQGRLYLRTFAGVWAFRTPS